MKDGDRNGEMEEKNLEMRDGGAWRNLGVDLLGPLRADGYAKNTLDDGGDLVELGKTNGDCKKLKD